MNRTTLNEAEEEAREFLRRVKALKANEYAMHRLSITGSPESAAVRRLSMELTRALAKMRRPS